MPRVAGAPEEQSIPGGDREGPFVRNRDLANPGLPSEPPLEIFVKSPLLVTPLEKASVGPKANHGGPVQAIDFPGRGDRQFGQRASTIAAHFPQGVCRGGKEPASISGKRMDWSGHFLDGLPTLSGKPLKSSRCSRVNRSVPSHGHGGDVRVGESLMCRVSGSHILRECAHGNAKGRSGSRRCFLLCRGT